MPRAFRNPQINLYVADVEASARFYREAFGFAETFRTPKEGAPVHVEVRLAELVLGLADVDATREMHSLGVGSGPPRGEVALWTDDVDAAFAELMAMGVPALSAPHDFLNLRAAWVSDPDGNPVQVVQRR